MVVCDLEIENIEVKDGVEIDLALSRRDDAGLNQFRLFRDLESDYPLLDIMVNNEPAWLCFLPEPEHAGFVSSGGQLNLPAGERTSFLSMEPQEENLPNEDIVPFSTALRAARQFAIDGARPRCLDCSWPHFTLRVNFEGLSVLRASWTRDIVPGPNYTRSFPATAGISRTR